jgi:hypothetical protein
MLVYAARGDLLSPIRFYLHGIVPKWVRKELPELRFRTHVGSVPTWVRKSCRNYVFVPMWVRYDKK